MKQTTTALAVAALALALPAQGDAPEKSLVEFEKLTADWKAANRTYRTEMAKVRASDRFAAARAAEDGATLRELLGSVERPDAAEFGRRALALADQYAGADAFEVLVFAANNLYDKEVFEGMIERVEEHFIGRADLDRMLANGMALNHFIGAEKTASLLARIVEENRNALPRAWAMYWQSLLVQRDRAASPAAKARAKGLMEQAGELAAGTILGDRIAGPKFEEERLQIGMVAPEIEGVDTDGVPFKLSDYRGKVVVLDFWGFW